MNLSKKIIWSNFREYFKIITYNNIKNDIIYNPKILIGLEIDDLIENDIKKIFSDKKYRIILPNTKASCDWNENRINIIVSGVPGKYFITDCSYG